MVVHLLQQLPADVLLHVFSYLPPEDKLRVRACCKSFDRLVSHRSLWRHYTACFSFKNGRYDPQFWASVARRGIRSAVVRAAKENHWRQLVVALPSLSTLVVDTGVQSKCLDHLNKFPKLKRLSLRGAAEYNNNNNNNNNNNKKKKTPGDVTITGLRVADPRQMTHVGLCEVGFASQQHFLAFLSQFTNLTSLACHSAAGRDQAEMFHCVVAGLPKLKHLSWALNPCHSAYTVGVPEKKCVGETTHQTLSSLELVVYDDSSLSDDTLRPLSRLQSLTVVYVPPHRGCRLKTWLGLFHHLSTLVVNEGPPPREYVRSIPATVTRLTLCGAHIQGTTSLTDLAVVASRVPGLLHLQLDPWPAACRSGLMLWKLFPALQSVKVRIWQIGEKHFLDFHRFPSMRRIEVVDDDDDAAAAESPRVSELSRRLLTLSGDRIRVMRSPRRRDPTACYHQVH